jgi:hypothetical protein
MGEILGLPAETNVQYARAHESFFSKMNIIFRIKRGSKMIHLKLFKKRLFPSVWKIRNFCGNRPRIVVVKCFAEYMMYIASAYLAHS